MRRLLTVVVLGLSIGIGAMAAFRYLPTRAAPLPDPAAVTLKIRDVARLETLDVTLYKKVRFAPDPVGTNSFWGDVVAWAAYSIRNAEGRAIIFADVHLGLDLEKFGAENVLVVGRTALIVLPPVKVQVELRPGETEVIGSNLDSKETAQLFELAKAAFEREVRADPALNRRARESSQRAIRALLTTLGFEEVRFVDVLPRPAGTG
jgi:hypothetical protein